MPLRNLKSIIISHLAYLKTVLNKTPATTRGSKCATETAQKFARKFAIKATGVLVTELSAYIMQR